MRLISFGKKIDNLYLSVTNKLIGSEFTTFGSKISKGETVVFVCCSKIWGSGNVSSNVFESNELIWPNKLYPYRALVNQIVIFKDPISFAQIGIDQIFRKELGKQWAYKILFTPGALPTESIQLLSESLNSEVRVEDGNLESFFKEHISIINLENRKRLGLS